MAVDLFPWAIDGNTHPAAGARVMTSALLGGVSDALNLSTVAYADPSHGVAYTTDFKVTQNGTPNMSVNVANGSAFVRSAWANNQSYHVRNGTGIVNLAVSAADATNARWDLVILEVRDSNFSGANDDARLVVVAGTPAASPADPSLAAFPNCLVLVRLTVPALDTTIGTAQITDLRASVSSWSQPRGEVAQILIAAGGPAGIAASITDLTFGGTPMSVTFTALAGRKYKITGNVRALQNTSTGVNELSIRDGSGTVLGKSSISAAATTIVQHNAIARTTPSAGSVTYKLSMSTTAGTTDPFGASTQPMTLIVEDIGGYVT